MTETSKQLSASRESPVLEGDSQRLPKSPPELPGEMGEALRPSTRVSRAGCVRYRAGYNHTLRGRFREMAAKKGGTTKG